MNIVLIVLWSYGLIRTIHPTQNPYLSTYYQLLIKLVAIYYIEYIQISYIYMQVKLECMKCTTFLFRVI